MQTTLVPPDVRLSVCDTLNLSDTNVTLLTIILFHSCIYVHITVCLSRISVICSEDHMVDWPSS